MRCGAGADRPAPSVRLLVSPFQQLAHDLRKDVFRLAALIVGRLPALAVRNDRQLDLRHALDTRSGARGLLERVPGDGDGVDTTLLQRCGVEQTARRAGPS